jgi:hypothetical protein
MYTYIRKPAVLAMAGESIFFFLSSSSSSSSSSSRLASWPLGVFAAIFSY